MSERDLLDAAEVARVRDVYRNRDDHADFLVYGSLAHATRVQDRWLKTLNMLAAAGVTDLAGERIVDLGCGAGAALHHLIGWGATASNVIGVDVRTEAFEEARERVPEAPYVMASGTHVPLQSASTSIVVLNTVLSSVLDPAIRAAITREVDRVLAPGGAVLWYDFFVRNPSNPDVTPIGAKELRRLFPSFDLSLRRKISLAPPLARRLPQRRYLAWYRALEAFPPLRTHYLGVFTKTS